MQEQVFHAAPVMIGWYLYFKLIFQAEANLQLIDTFLRYPLDSYTLWSTKAFDPLLLSLYICTVSPT